MPSVIMLSVIKLNVTYKHYLLSVFMHNIVKLSVVAPFYVSLIFCNT
jgi:hypothetical protein